MLIEQINGFTALVYCLVFLFVAFVVWCLGLLTGYERGLEDGRKYRKPTKPIRTYKTPKVLPSSAMPKVKQATAYTIKRRNRAY